jgi:uncharacterized protein (DUF2141 family)
MSCANIQPISGGPEDNTAPQMDESNSSKNYQTFFNEKEIILSFDEWIIIDNPAFNISISPPTDYAPEIKIKGKKIIIRFDEREKLKENTTYNVQFGEGIKDITKGNIQRNLQFVFSTGAHLDSMMIRGTVLDAFSKKPKDRVLVSLYKNLDDTAFKKTKPFYFSWTDSSGKFSLNHLSPGTYRLYALDDKNQNFYYDQITESFAFYPDSIQPAATVQEFLLYLSASITPSVIREKKLVPGKGSFIFDIKPITTKLWCDQMDSIKYVNLKDSFLVWNFSSKEHSCILNYGERKDSFKIQPDSMLHPFQSLGIRIEQALLKPGDDPAFIFEAPVFKINKDSIVSADTLKRTFSIISDSIDIRKFKLSGNFESNRENILIIKEHSVISNTGAFNKQDTFLFRYLDKVTLSRMNLSLDNLQTGKHYILQLLNGESIQFESQVTATSSMQKMFFKNLIPGKYRMRLIDDRNHNGQWDPAILGERKPAETVWYFELPELRADWDVDVTLKL